MHTAEAAAEAAAAPAAGPAAPGTFWYFFSKCSGPSSSGPSSLFQIDEVSSSEFLANKPSTHGMLQLSFGALE